MQEKERIREDGRYMHKERAHMRIAMGVRMGERTYPMAGTISRNERGSESYERK